VKIPFLPMIFF